MKRLKSTYRDEWSFRTVHSQFDALDLSENRFESEYRHDTVGLVESNPLHLPDFWLAGIDTAINRTHVHYV